MALSVGRVEGELELIDKFSARLDAIASNVAKNTAAIEAHLKRTQKEVQGGLGASLTQLGQKLEDTGGKLRSAGMTMTAAFTLPIVGALGASVKAAVSFESAFAGVRKTVDGVTDSAGNLTAFGKQVEQDFRNMAKVMPASVEEISKVGEAAGALGVKAGNLTKFTQVMVKLGATTNLSSDDAATALARFTNVMGTSEDQIENLASALVGLGNDGASTEREIMEMAGRLAGAGKTIGLTEGSVLGLANALSSLGLEAEMGGTAMQKMMLDMATSVSSGKDNLSNFAKVVGVTNEEFQRLFKSDPSQALGRFVEGFARIKTEGGDLLKVLAAFDIKEARMTQTMLRLGNAGTMVADSMEKGNKLVAENTALNREYEQRVKTSAAQLTIFWNKLKDVGITFGGALLPVMSEGIKIMEPLIKKLETLAKWFGDLPGPIKATMLGILGLAAVIGPLLGLLGFFASGIGSIIGVAALFVGKTVPATTGGFTAVGTSAGIAKNAVLGLQGAIVALSVMAIAKFVQEAIGLMNDAKKWAQDAAQNNAAFERTRALASKVPGYKPEMNIDQVHRLMYHENLRKQMERENAGKPLTLNLKTFGQMNIGGVNPTTPPPVVTPPVVPPPGGGNGNWDAPGEDAAKKLLAYQERMQKLSDTIRGADLVEQMREWNKAIGDFSTLSPAALKRVGDEAARLQKEGTNLEGSLLKAWIAGRKWREGMPEITNGLDGILKHTKDVSAAGMNMFDFAKTGTVKWGESIKITSLAASTVMGRAKEAGFATRAEMDATATAAERLALDMRNSGGRFTDAAIKQAEERAKALRREANGGKASFTEMLGGIAATLNAVFSNINSRWGQMAQVATAAMMQIADKAKNLGEKMAAGFAAAANILAMLGGANPNKLVQAGVGALAGAGAGASIGFMIGGPMGAGIGAGIGAVVGGIAGLVGAHNKEKEARKAANATLVEYQRELLKTYGSMANISTISKVVGVDLAAAWNSRGVQGLEHFKKLMDEFQAKMKLLHETLDEFGLSWKDLGIEMRQMNITEGADKLLDKFKLLTSAGMAPDKAIKAMSGSLSQLIIDAAQTGTKIPASLQPILEQMIRMGSLTEDAARAMLGLGDSSMPKLEDIRAAAERYGFTLDELGPKVAQLQLTESANQIVADWELLIKAGADVNVLFGKMGDDIQKMVDQALRTGLALPESMKPMLQSLVDAGKLTDIAGGKLTDLSGINFEESLTGKIDELIDALKAFIDTIAGPNGAANALENLGRTKVSRVGIPWGYDHDGSMPPGGMPNRPTTDMPEVSNAGVSAVAASSAQGGRGGRAIVNLDGRTIAEVVVPLVGDVNYANGLG